MSDREFVNSEAAIADGVQRIADALETVGLPVLVKALTEEPPPDTRVVTLIASMMRDSEWDADLATAIADQIGTVRPHPGDQPPFRSPKPSQQQIIDMGCDELEEAMPPYMLAHFRGDHWNCPPAECVRAEPWRAGIGQARVQVQDRVPVTSLNDLLVEWGREHGYRGSPREQEKKEALLAALVEREETISEYLIGAAGVRGPELRSSTIAVMHDAGMEVNEDAL